MSRWSAGQQESRGFTMIEIMITVFLIVVIGLTGFMSLTNLLPKIRLSRSARDLENLLSRAQSEAFARNQPIGVQILESQNQVTAELFIDEGVGADVWVRNTAAKEPAISTIQFRRSVQMVDKACNPSRLTGGCGGAGQRCITLMFDGNGQAVAGPGYIVGGTPLPPGTPVDHEIILLSERVGQGVNAREIEVLSAGLIQLVKLGQRGNAAPLKKPGGTQANGDCP